MANYPTIKLEGRENEYLDTIWDSELWDVSKMPSKLYLHAGNGVLVAIRPKFFVEVDSPTEHASGTRQIFGFEKPGEPECTIDVSTKWDKDLLFLSPDDFTRFRTEGKGSYSVPTCSLSEALRENGYSVGKGGITLWYNNDGVPSRSTSSSHKYRAWTDRAGVHADHNKEGRWGHVLFRTRDDCVNALQKMQVLDFDDEVPEPEGIMDDTNGHESELVRRINDAWNKYRGEFYPILCALYARDIGEIFQSGAFAWPEAADEQYALDEMKAQWDYHACNYLQHIADNNDLSTILHFLNYANR